MHRVEYWRLSESRRGLAVLTMFVILSFSGRGGSAADEDRRLCCFQTSEAIRNSAFPNGRVRRLRAPSRGTSRNASTRSAGLSRDGPARCPRCLRVGTPRARSASFAVWVGRSTRVASRCTRSPLRPSVRRRCITSSASGSACRSTARSLFLTAPGTATSWSSASRASPVRPNGIGPTKRSTTSSAC